jgi:hypothetical protein
MPFAALQSIVDDFRPYDSLFTLPFGAEIDRRRIGRRRSRYVPAFDVVARVGVKGKHILNAPMRAEGCFPTVAPQAAEQRVLQGKRRVQRWQQKRQSVTNLKSRVRLGNIHSIDYNVAMLAI